MAQFSLRKIRQISRHYFHHISEDKGRSCVLVIETVKSAPLAVDYGNDVFRQGFPSVYRYCRYTVEMVEYQYTERKKNCHTKKKHSLTVYMYKEKEYQIDMQLESLHMTGYAGSRD